MRQHFVKRLRGLAFLLALALLLTACQARDGVLGEQETAATIPPAQNPYAAPTDTAQLTYPAAVNLYLPSRDGQRLLARQREVTLSRDSDNVRAILLSLFGSRPDENTEALGHQVTLQLSGTAPIECAGDVCTVNLSPSALALEYDELYTVALSIAATVSDQTPIRYVNLLVAEQALSFDVGGNLPAGSVSAHPGEDLPVLWEQLTARRTALGDSPALTPLTATATLYFPLKDGSGFMPETRNLTFAGQSAAQLASGLLSALSSGAQYVQNACDMPDLTALLSLPPQVTPLAEGGRQITLHFPQDLPAQLQAAGIDMSCFVASVTWTLSTFIPSVGAVRIYTGSTLMTALSSPAFGNLAFEDGQIRRRQFRDGLRDQTSVLMSNGSRLVRVRRDVAAANVRNPLTLLQLMMVGPGEAEVAQGIRPPLPAGLDTTDIVGIAVEDGTLLVNLSPRFASGIRGMDASAERLCCYALVDTLCEAVGVQRVRFYWYGEVLETLGGEIAWDGVFLLNRALIE